METATKVRNRLKSDMRLVTDYLAGGRNYVPGDQQVIHIEAVLDMLYELTGDERYQDVSKVLLQRKEGGEKITMCEILDSFIERGVQKGIAEGVSQGISQGVSQGRTQGENLLAKLMEYLFGDNRIEDARLASTDEEMRKRFYREYELV